MAPLRPLPEVPASRRFDWDAVEGWLVEGFDGRPRRSGEAMAYHSIRVGRALRDQHASPATILAGYLHDVGEDLRLESARIAAVARSLLEDEEIAAQAARLVEVVSYSPTEYDLPRTERKQAATARWLADGDLRVALIKQADIDDNDADADLAGVTFAAAYREWAQPLREALAAKLGPRPDGGTFTYHLLDDLMPFRVFYRERLKAGAQAPDRTLGLLRWQHRFLSADFGTGWVDDIDRQRFSEACDDHYASQPAVQAQKPVATRQGTDESRRVVLLRQENPFWMVDAAIEDGKLSICSGDARREWYVIVEADQRERLLQALRSHCGAEPARAADAPDRETLELLARGFSGRAGLLEEIKAWLEQTAIPYRSTVW